MLLLANTILFSLLFMCMCVCMHVYMYVFMYIYVYIYIYIYIHICIYIYIYIQTHITHIRDTYKRIRNAHTHTHARTYIQYLMFLLANTILSVSITLICIMTVFFSSTKKPQGLNSRSKMHRFEVCSQRFRTNIHEYCFLVEEKKTVIMHMRILIHTLISIMIVFFLAQKKTILIPNAENKDWSVLLWLRNSNLSFFFGEKKDSHYGNQSIFLFCFFFSFTCIFLSFFLFCFFFSPFHSAMWFWLLYFLYFIFALRTRIKHVQYQTAFVILPFP